MSLEDPKIKTENMASLKFANLDKAYDPIMSNLYNENEKTNKNKNDKKQNFREAVDMEKYHMEMYNLQMEESKKKRLAVEKDAAKRVADYNDMTKQLNQRYDDFLKAHQKDGWDGLENHWYWKHYIENVDKPGYTPLDNHLDNMKDDRFYPIELSNNGYAQIGEFEENTNISSNFVEKPAMYKSNIGNFIYNYGDNIIYPEKKLLEKNETQLKDETDEKAKLERAFNIKQQELKKLATR